MRAEFTKAVKLEAWRGSQGRCMGCTAKLFPGNIEYHHDKECAFGGKGTKENCVVLCRACHSRVTKERAPVIAKSNRVRNRHIGVKKPRTITRWRRFDKSIVIATRER